MCDCTIERDDPVPPFPSENHPAKDLCNRYQLSFPVYSWIQLLGDDHPRSLLSEPHIKFPHQPFKLIPSRFRDGSAVT